MLYSWMNKTVRPLERQKSVLDLTGYIDSVVKQNMYKLVTTARFGIHICPLCRIGPWRIFVNK